MSIKKFFTTEFTVKRLEWADNSSDLETQGTIEGHLQQSTDDNLEEYTGLRFSKPYMLFCDIDADVQENDRLESGGDKYDVRYIIKANIGNNAHLQLFLEKVDG